MEKIPLEGFYSEEGELPISFPFKIQTYREYLLIQVFDRVNSKEVFAIYKDDELFSRINAPDFNDLIYFSLGSASESTQFEDLVLISYN
jgi:hypothetical protein